MELIWLISVRKTTIAKTSTHIHSQNTLIVLFYAGHFNTPDRSSPHHSFHLSSVARPDKGRTESVGCSLQLRSPLYCALLTGQIAQQFGHRGAQRSRKGRWGEWRGGVAVAPLTMWRCWSHGTIEKKEKYNLELWPNGNWTTLIKSFPASLRPLSMIFLSWLTEAFSKPACSWPWISTMLVCKGLQVGCAATLNEIYKKSSWNPFILPTFFIKQSQTATYNKLGRLNMLDNLQNQSSPLRVLAGFFVIKVHWTSLCFFFPFSFHGTHATGFNKADYQIKDALSHVWAGGWKWERHRVVFVALLDYPPYDKLLSGVVSGLSYSSQRLQQGEPISTQPTGNSPHPEFTLRKMCTQDTQALDTAGGSKLALIGRLTSCLSLKLVLISSFHFFSILFRTPRVQSCAHFSGFFLSDCRLHTLISASYHPVSSTHTWFSKCTVCFSNHQHLHQLSVLVLAALQTYDRGSQCVDECAAAVVSCAFNCVNPACV